MAIMGLPAPISELSYQKVMKDLCKKSVSQAEQLMSAAAQRLISIIKAEEPESHLMEHRNVDAIVQRQESCLLFQ